MAPQDPKDLAVPLTDGPPGDLSKAIDEEILFSKQEGEIYQMILRQRGRTPYNPNLYKPLAYSATESFGRTNLRNPPLAF